MGNITPKEAIANLNHIYGIVSPDIQRSLDVAIKALERPQGDLISREALIREIGRTDEWYKGRSVCAIIDNAPTVEQNWRFYYDHGYHQAKEDIARRIKEQYNEHHELIPYWLSVGDTKGGAE